jgi:hypothetical protein
MVGEGCERWESYSGDIKLGMVRTLRQQAMNIALIASIGICPDSGLLRCKSLWPFILNLPSFPLLPTSTCLHILLQHLYYSRV